MTKTEHEDELRRLRELEKQYAVMETKVEALQKKLDSISSGLSKVLWVFGGGLISGIATWIMSGGMAK